MNNNKINVDKLRCQIDGNALCITTKDFVDQGESEAVFIELTPDQIKEIQKLCSEIGHKWGDDWIASNFGTFSATCVNCGHKETSEGIKNE